MSWAEVVAGTEITARASPYDTKRFGFPVARVTVPGKAEDVSLSDVVAEVYGQEFDVCVLRYPARNSTWFHELAALGFNVTFADTLVYWRLALDAPNERMLPAGASDSRLDQVPEDIVEDLVTRTFTRYRNHYMANPRFDPTLVLDGYRDWAIRSARADQGLLLRMTGEPVALATTEHSGTIGEVLLAGVAPEHQAHGWYTHLLTAIDSRARSAGARDLVISTQGHNTQVQRAWSRYGFVPVECHATVHLNGARRVPR